MSAPGAYAKGTPIVRKFPFAYNTPGLNDGVTVYTPRVGDILLDAWIEIETAWDGTTPKGDAGPIAGPGESGWWANSPSNEAAPIDMTNNDTTLVGALSDGGSLLLSHMNTHDEFEIRRVPARFVGANPIQVLVSQNGLAGGDDPGATQGAARLYLVTATPL